MRAQHGMLVKSVEGLESGYILKETPTFLDILKDSTNFN